MPDVLIIDDNPTQLRVREAVLQGAGFSVLTAESAEEALRVLQQVYGLRVIITDHVLPGAKGHEFVRELRISSPAVPVLVITGMAEAEPEYAGLNITFLHKPCAPEDLIAEVSKVIGA